MSRMFYVSVLSIFLIFVWLVAGDISEFCVVAIVKLLLQREQLMMMMMLDCRWPHYKTDVILCWNSYILSCDICMITRAHSFLRQILPNSMGQFAKFRGSPRQNCSNFAAYHGHLFVSKLSSILSKNCSFYASNIKRQLSIFFLFYKCNLSSRIVFLYDWAVLR